MKISAVCAGFIAGAWAIPHHALVHRRQAQTTNGILPPSEDPWYTGPPNYETAKPGTILRLRAAQGNLTSIIANSSAAYNILYATTDSQYRPTWAVTTLLIPIPSNSSTLEANKLLSYQIPYDSAYIDASPSYSLYGAAGGDVSSALGRGWYVNVPDYEGPSASFTAGVISGHATLDSVRAVLSSGFGLVNGTRYAMWGYSGGALASEWASELQNQYAPELEFAGTAMGGLTPNVTSVLLTVNGGLEAGLIPAGILGLASQYPDLEQYLRQNIKTEGEYNATTFFNARNQTLGGTIGTFLNKDITNYFTNGVDSLQEPIPQKVINRDGVMGYHGVPRMPVFAYKAIQDEVSPVNDTDALIARYCGIGATIRYDRNTVGSHTQEAGNGDARAFQFLTSVLNGMYNATGCQISNVTIGGNSTQS